ncbi:MAG: type II secretion system F family protein [Planctomycetota bacterium]
MNSTQGMDAEILVEQSAHGMMAALKVKLALQVAPIRWQSSLERVADRIEAGATLDEAIQAELSKMPGEMRCIASESLRVADPTAFIVDACKIRREVRASWNKLSRLCFYPLCLFVFALSVGLLFSFIMKHMIDLDWIEQWGLRGMDHVQGTILDQHHAIVGMAMVTAWVLVALVVIYLLGPPWAWLAVLGGVFVIGRPLRWLNMQEILCRYNMFLKQGVPLSEAAWAVSSSFASSSQAVVSRAIANRIDSGMPLGKAVAGSMLSDGIIRPSLYLMDESADELPEALARNTDLLGKLVERRCRSLGTLIPVFLLIAVATIIWSAFMSYAMAMLPLFSMIQSLAW